MDLVKIAALFAIAQSVVYLASIGVGLWRGGTMNLRPWVMAILMLGTWLSVGFDYYDHHFGTPNYKVAEQHWIDLTNSLPITSDDDLTNQLTRIDGRKFVNCKLGGVGGSVLLFEGEAPAQFENCTVNGPITFQSDNPIVAGAFSLEGTMTHILGGSISCKTTQP